MSKNELLLLADEYFSGFQIELAADPEDSRVYSEHGQDITLEFFSFIEMVLRMHGVR